MTWELMEIIEATGATPTVLSKRPVTLKGISTDSRTIRQGDLFVALEGERFDGHQFVQEAVERGAAAILAQRWDPLFGEVAHIPQLFVPDTLVAYGRIAAAYRRRLKARVIAITGSMGKTTVKEMAHAILSKKYKTAKTEKNENNRVGVPKTLLGVSPDAERVVVEMGSNIPGEIGVLTEIARPDAALITNIAPVHLERFHSLEGVRIEKSALFWRAPAHARRFVNQDDAEARKIPLRLEWSIETFGTESQARVQGTEMVSMGLKGTSFTLSAGEGRVRVALSVLGAHHVRNAVAASAIGVSEGIPLDQIRDALEAFQGVAGRLEPIHASQDCVILNDSYNANPAAMTLAIQTLASFNATRVTIALLGDMRELGEKARAFHEEVGRACARYGIHLLGLTGDYAEAVRAGALGAGFDAEKIFLFEDEGQLLRHLRPFLHRPSMILVKGSFALHMDRWVRAILSELKTKEGGA